MWRRTTLSVRHNTRNTRECTGGWSVPVESAAAVWRQFDPLTLHRPLSLSLLLLLSRFPTWPPKSNGPSIVRASWSKI